MITKHMIRTLMIETPTVPGNLGKVATAIGVMGGDIGEVETVKVGPNYTMRNITVQAENEEYRRKSFKPLKLSVKASGFIQSQMKCSLLMKAAKFR